MANSKKQKGIVESQHELERKSFQREQSLKSKNFISDESLEQAESKFLQSEMSVNNMYASVEGLQIEILQLQDSLKLLE